MYLATLLKIGSSISTTNVETKPSDSVEMTPKGVNHKQSVTVTLIGVASALHCLVDNLYLALRCTFLVISTFNYTQYCYNYPINAVTTNKKVN